MQTTLIHLPKYILTLSHFQLTFFSPSSRLCLIFLYFRWSPDYREGIENMHTKNGNFCAFLTVWIIIIYVTWLKFEAQWSIGMGVKDAPISYYPRSGLDFGRSYGTGLVKGTVMSDWVPNARLHKPGLWTFTKRRCMGNDATISDFSHSPTTKPTSPPNRISFPSSTPAHRVAVPLIIYSPLRLIQIPTSSPTSLSNPGLCDL